MCAYKTMADTFKGYTYSVFNLVYETNTPSCRIWDALGFKRIGRVKGCGNLKSYPNQLIDALIYGRDLGQESDDAISEERFDRIKFYLKNQRYPDGADRAEKSRLRSASTHYKLVPATEFEPDRLMLKGKEVIADPQQQYDVARRVHMEQHGGINKTTAIITERYHWVRIKDTVTQVIKNCTYCKEAPAKTIYPYGRRELHPKLTTIPPFDREFSVPAGEKSLRAHGYPPEDPESTQLPAQAATPGAYADDGDADAETAPETDHFAGFLGTAITFPEFGNPSNETVPVDPELTNGLGQPTDFHQLEREVQRLQRTQVFGTSIFEPQESRAPQPTIETSGPSRRSSRRVTAVAEGVVSPRPSRRSSTQAQQRKSAVQPQAEEGLLDVIQYNAMASQPVQQNIDTPPAKSTRGAKRQLEHADETGGSGKRASRRKIGPVDGIAGHVSDEAWRRQMGEHGG